MVNTEHVMKTKNTFLKINIEKIRIPVFPKYLTNWLLLCGAALLNTAHTPFKPNKLYKQPLCKTSELDPWYLCPVCNQTLTDISTFTCWVTALYHLLGTVNFYMLRHCYIPSVNCILFQRKTSIFCFLATSLTNVSS